MTKWLLLSVGTAWIACSTAYQLPTIIYEQSGGLGGIREYRLVIDSSGRARLERWSGWRDTTALQWQLAPRDQKALADAFDRLPDSLFSKSSMSQELRPDAPLRMLTIGRQHSTRQVVIGTAPDAELWRLVTMLDSLARSVEER
jgi:hypothetical protein